MQNLSCYGRIIYSIKMISLRCKKAEIRHSTSFRRQVFMILNKSVKSFDLVLKHNLDYVMYASTESMKCFECGEIGHLKHACLILNSRKGQSENGTGDKK
ncbi:hypothetical protein FKM82_012617 [Ascaphus truei]